jgi:hypothetical protein
MKSFKLFVSNDTMMDGSYIMVKDEQKLISSLMFLEVKMNYVPQLALQENIANPVRMD